MDEKTAIIILAAAAVIAVIIAAAAIAFNLKKAAKLFKDNNVKKNKAKNGVHCYDALRFSITPNNRDRKYIK